MVGEEGFEPQKTILWSTHFSKNGCATKQRYVDVRALKQDLETTNTKKPRYKTEALKVVGEEGFEPQKTILWSAHF
ncbi:hypothetical protein BSQ33_09285 [Vibrio gazogenes]|uniref:Uncharacterized protein n=1 Tax=Vibrio gazogenes TaxID=687 RepID=A0A1Z2SFC6_VIBGA|nr:hypothetical protein BSQ33_09285 [Vibrio gazogenes]